MPSSRFSGSLMITILPLVFWKIYLMGSGKSEKKNFSDFSILIFSALSDRARSWKLIFLMSRSINPRKIRKTVENLAWDYSKFRRYEHLGIAQLIILWIFWVADRELARYQFSGKTSWEMENLMLTFIIFYLFFLLIITCSKLSPTVTYTYVLNKINL